MLRNLFFLFEMVKFDMNNGGQSLDRIYNRLEGIVPLVENTTKVWYRMHKHLRHQLWQSVFSTAEHERDRQWAEKKIDEGYLREAHHHWVSPVELNVDWLVEYLPTSDLFIAYMPTSEEEAKSKG